MPPTPPFGQRCSLVSSGYIYCMIQAALLIPSSVLQKIHESQLPKSYFDENTYFIGQGQERFLRMSDGARIAAIVMAHADTLSGKWLSKSTFEAEFPA